MKNAFIAFLVVIIHFFLQIFILGLVDRGGLGGLKTLGHFYIAVITSTIVLILVLVARQSELSQSIVYALSAVFSVTLMALITVLVLSSEFGPWRIIQYGTLGGGTSKDVAFRTEIIILVGIFNLFLTAMIGAYDFRFNLKSDFAGLAVVVVYCFIVTDFALQPKAEYCYCDSNTIEPHTYKTGDNKKICNYKYTFLFLKVGQECRKL
ncbi:MAG: hypothetical protein WD077_15845 [Bacteroidia bacterium]